MAPRLDLEARMTIRELLRRGWSRCAIAATLSVCEGSVRYHERRAREGAEDGRKRQVQLASRYEAAIEGYLRGLGEGEAWNLASLHAWLVAEQSYPGSLRSVERYVARHYGAPPKRARRRVETPPGGQGQADWAQHRGVVVGRREQTLWSFHLKLSHSRYGVEVWSPSKDLLSWLEVHNRSFERLGGVPATVRVDNEKTAVVRGAGAWGVIHPVYRRYALSARFHIDACAPRQPQAKGKVEREIGVDRSRFDARQRPWDSLEELQAERDAARIAEAKKRRCPATGSTVWEAFEAERQHLGSLPSLPEPFDVVVERRVGPDCTVAFEGRSYSVPFRLLGRSVEIRGGARHVLVLDRGAVVARHPRRSEARIVIDPSHFDGEATAGVLPPPPLGRMGKRLVEIAAMEPQRRPLDLYAALAEVAR
jgi:transposase